MADKNVCNVLLIVLTVIGWLAVLALLGMGLMMGDDGRNDKLLRQYGGSLCCGVTPGHGICLAGGTDSDLFERQV